MIKELLLPMLLSATFGGASVGAGMKFYADHIYQSQITALEIHADLSGEILAMNAQIKASSDKQRVLQLQGWINGSRRTADQQGRGLTTTEKNRIAEWQAEIDIILKGW